MNVEIIPIEDHKQYNVNGHVVYKDNDENWISNTAMSDKENRAFRRYKTNVIDNPRFKTHTKAIYKG